ncbi:unnamed protein product [Caenorhabditis nigoni]
MTSWNEHPGIASNKTYMNWWTNSPENIPKVSKSSDILPLLIGGFLIWHYLFSMICFIFSFCAERAIATLLSGDYEKHQRKNPLVICSVVFYSIAPWRKALVRDYPFLQSRFFVSSKTQRASSSKASYQQTADLYFKQLQTSWFKK